MEQRSEGRKRRRGWRGALGVKRGEIREVMNLKAERKMNRTGKTKEVRKNPRGGTFMGKIKRRREETGNRSRRGAKQR